MQEQWKDIKGYEGLYQVSDLGNVRNAKTKRFRKLCVVTSTRNPLGYYNVILYKHGKGTNFSIHRLVATMFIPNLSNKPTVNHINGNRFDNRVSNLEWATYAENSQHAVRHRLRNDIGEDSFHAKLCNRDAFEIVELYKSGLFTQKELGELYGVTQPTISLLINKKNWGEILKKY